MARKLSDEDVRRLRELEAEGWSPVELAEEFGISRQHAGRLVRGAQRPRIAGLDARALASGVSAAVDNCLDGVDLGSADAVRAATVRALAAKLDACAAS